MGAIRNTGRKLAPACELSVTSLWQSEHTNQECLDALIPSWQGFNIKAQDPWICLTQRGKATSINIIHHSYY